MNEGAQLPRGWITAPLFVVANTRLGKMLDARKQLSGKPFPYLRNVNVRWDSFDLSSLQTMTFDSNEIKEFELLPGDVLICEGGEPGRAAVWSELNSEVKFQKAIHRVRLCGQIEPRWLMHQLRLDAIQGRLEDYFTGTTIKHFTGVALAKYPIVIPPLPEQRRIVAKIEALQVRSRKVREALEAIPPLLEQFRQSVLAAAFRGDLTADWREQHSDTEPASVLLERIRAERRRKWEQAELAKFKANCMKPKDDSWKEKYVEPEPVDDSDLPELPDGWCWGSAEEVVDPDSEIVYGIVQPGPQLTKGVPYVRGCDIQDGTIQVDQLFRTSKEIAQRYERASLRGGDVLLGIIRATKVAVVPNILDGANITQGTARFRPSSAITTDFLAGWLDAPFAQGWLHDHYRGIDMPGLNLRDVRRLPVPLAPRTEQVTVAEVLRKWKSSYVSLRGAVETAFIQVNDLDQSILAKAFRGELVPHDPSDEPASALLERIQVERAEVTDGKLKRGRRKQVQ